MDDPREDRPDARSPQEKRMPSGGKLKAGQSKVEQDRRAAALRANLHRRKAGARAEAEQASREHADPEGLSREPADPEGLLRQRTD